MQFFLEARQQKLFQDILVVYPITQGKSGEYSIRGIELPYDFRCVANRSRSSAVRLLLTVTSVHVDRSAVKDDETLSSGVGYLVHVLLMLSKFWEVRRAPSVPSAPPAPLTAVCCV